MFLLFLCVTVKYNDINDRIFDFIVDFKDIVMVNYQLLVQTYLY